MGTLVAKGQEETVIAELERLIKNIREGTVRCVSIHKMTSAEKIGTTYDGSAIYQRTEGVDISFSGVIK